MEFSKTAPQAGHIQPGYFCPWLGHGGGLPSPAQLLAEGDLGEMKTWAKELGFRFVGVS